VDIPSREYSVSLIPDNVSVEVSVTTTGEEYQPFLNVPARAAVLIGCVRSIFTPETVSEVRLPA
jgi:hypothetical protein